MGRFLLAVVLASCTHAATTSPAWPKASEPEEDGGESLAPHETKQVSVAVEKSADETKPEPKAEAKPAAAAAAAEPSTAPAAAAATAQPTDESITSEEIIIDVDD